MKAPGVTALGASPQLSINFTSMSPNIPLTIHKPMINTIHGLED
jgi:hypothetical protein